MAQPYTVEIPGGGQMVVNANSPEAARENAGIPGGVVHAGGYQSSGGENYPASPTSTTPNNQDQAALNQLVSGQDALLKAIAEGNMDAFREAVRQFDVSFGLDQSKFTESVRQFNEGLGISQAGLTGVYQGQPTLQAQLQAENIAQTRANLTGQFQGAPTLAAQQQAYTQGTGLVSQIAGLQANPFRQQTAMGQLSNLLGGRGVSGFGQIGTVPGAGTGGLGYMQQMIDDIRNPGANQAGMNQVLDAIPTPNKLNSTEFFRSPQSTQNMVLQGMQEKYGISPEDALGQIKNTMPGFQSPSTFGQVKRPTF